MSSPFSLAIALLFSLLFCFGCREVEPISSFPQSNEKDLIQVLVPLMQQKNWKEAWKIVEQAIAKFPDDAGHLVLAAQIQAALGNRELPLQFYDRLLSIDPDQGARVVISNAENLINENGEQPGVVPFDESSRFEFAIEHYLLLAKRFPEHPLPRQKLAGIYNAIGRRREGAIHTYELLRQGKVSVNDLLSLINLSAPFVSPEFAQRKRDANSLLCLSDVRGMLAMQNYDQAKEVLGNVLRGNPRDTTAMALHGRLLAEAGDLSELATWHGNLPASVQNEPDYWIALGRWLETSQRHTESVRCLIEGVLRDPTDRYAWRLLRQVLDALGHVELAKEVAARVTILDQIHQAATSDHPSDQRKLPDLLRQVDRPWEALAWQFQIAEQTKSLQTEAPKIAAEHRLLASRSPAERSTKGFPFNADLDKWPLPNFDNLGSGLVTRSFKEAFARIQLVDVAKTSGIAVPYRSDFRTDYEAFYLYQVNGAGVAVVDFDLDNSVDVFIVHSMGRPQHAGSGIPPSLFRQAKYGQFSEVQHWAVQPSIRGFGQGASSIDLNQDGFPDLLVANIGCNRILRNQGDGTFVDATTEYGWDDAAWTSSFIGGDLDGDHLPDLVAINYIDDARVFEIRCLRGTYDCAPQNFRGAVNRMMRNRGDGHFEPMFEEELALPRSYGFGGILTNFDRQHGNDLFIANDVLANQFWVSQPLTAEKGGSRFGLREQGTLSGCATGTHGELQGSMGVAWGDFDRNGKIDLHVTNFYNEPVNLYLQQSPGRFVDKAIGMRLHKESLKVLGFGTQAADFNLDGWLDLAVLNGHIYDARHQGIPFQMPAQIFAGGHGGFQQVAEGEYWARPQLGRTLTVLDWNRDGKPDLLATHLDQPTALLENRSEGENWIQLELVGVSSERDAIGAEVRVECGSEQWVTWVVGGHGLMCSNEGVLGVGIGMYDIIDRLTVEWPSGQRSVFVDLPANERYLVVEGKSEVIIRNRSVALGATE